ncbi:MAG: hypothetical protein JWO48_2218, partial [Bryobacterales bacterium]|nr:hypothetical protein [Bryobacterales bacterium]
MHKTRSFLSGVVFILAAVLVLAQNPPPQNPPPQRPPEFLSPPSGRAQEPQVLPPAPTKPAQQPPAAPKPTQQPPKLDAPPPTQTKPVAPSLAPGAMPAGYMVQNASLVEVIDILARALKINYI